MRLVTMFDCSTRIDISNPWQRQEAARLIRLERANGTRDRALALRHASFGAIKLAARSDNRQTRFAYRFIQEALLSAI